MQQSGIEVVHMHWILCDGVPQVIGFAEAHSAFGATACDPHSKSIFVMIAARLIYFFGALCKRRPAELRRPHH